MNAESYNSYDSNGQVSETVNDENIATKYNYNTNGNVLDVTQSIKDNEQVAAQFEYETNNPNKLTTATNSSGVTIDYEYSNGQVTEQVMTSPAGKIITESMTYIQNGNYLKTFTDANGGVTTYFYDNQDDPIKGLVTAIQDPNGNITTFTYDSMSDELLSTEGSATPSTSKIVSYTYDNGNVETVTSNGIEYTYSYDDLDRVSTVALGNTTLITNTYDSYSRLWMRDYATGESYRASHDDFGRLTYENWNNQSIASYYYDADSNLVRVDNPDVGLTYHYNYTIGNNISEITSSDGMDTKYYYDASGKLCFMKSYKDGELILDERFKDNAKGNVEKIIIPTFDNALIQYNYDDLDRVTSCSMGANYVTYEYPVIYDPETDTNHTNKQIQSCSYRYSEDDWEILSIDYTYDNNGNITGVSYSGEYQLEKTYTYDSQNRLLSETSGNTTYNYLYDDNGRFLQRYTSTPSATNYYVYDDYGIPVSKGRKTYSHDEMGNITYNGSKYYVWGKGGRLEQVKNNSGTVIAEYKYNHEGKCVQRIYNTSVTNYYYAGDLLVRMKRGGTILDFIYDSTGRAIGVKYRGNCYYYLYNLEGDVVAITDQNGDVCGSYSYDAFGNCTAYYGDDIMYENPLKYRGGIYDERGEFYTIGTKHYSPEMMRFLESDAYNLIDDPQECVDLFICSNYNMVSAVSEHQVSDLSADEIFKNFACNVLRFTDSVIARGCKPISDKVENTLTNLFDFWVTPLEGYVMDLYTAKLVRFFVGSSLARAILIGISKRWPDFSNTIFDYPTGVRHLFPFDMSGMAKLGAYALGFTEGVNGNGKTIYYSENHVGNQMWQSNAGYLPLYDRVFSLGGPIYRNALEFQKTDINNNTTYYVVWLWKGDYWNLGVGAEIGLYYTKDEEMYNLKFYEIDPELTMTVDMNIKYEIYNILHQPHYEEIELFNGHDDNAWWFCAFAPDYQFPDIDRIKVDLNVSFNDKPNFDLDDGLIDAFSEKYQTHPESNSLTDWSVVSILQPSEMLEAGYQFRIHY